jgi:hypothetical protein
MKNTVLFLSAICGLGLAGAARAETIEVPADFATIQAAIDAAASGDIIHVAAGEYGEDIQPKSDIQLRGEETARTILRPSTAGATVQISNISNVVIRNFTFVNSETGINIASGFNIDIDNNVFDVGNSGTGVAITTLDSTVEIINNTFFDNRLAIDGTSDQATIQNNIFALNDTVAGNDIDDATFSFNCFTGNPIGSDAVTGDPDFVDTGSRDFHLLAGSPCIDVGTGTDQDSSAADAGAYGGQFADTQPLPVAQPGATVSPTSTPSVFDIQVNWQANLDYRVDGYRLYYDSDQSGAPYEGTDAQDAGGQPVPSPIDAGNATSFTLHNLNAVAAVPGAPVLQAPSPSNQSVALRWSAVTDADAYRIHYGIASLDENQIDVGNVTSHEINGLENGTVYRFTVTAVNQPTYYLAVTAIDNGASQPNESELSEERTVTLGEAQESPPSNEVTATPETVEPFPDLPDQGDTRCFIATAAYGHYSKPEVQALRDFRDVYLMKHSLGRAFVQWYYAWSPPAAAFIHEHPVLRALTAWALLPVVGMAYLLVHAAPALAIALFALCLSLATLLVSRAARLRARR